MGAKIGTVSSRTAKYWLERGLDIERANLMAKSRTPGTIEYYEIFKGMAHDEAVIASADYKSNSALTRDNFIKKYGASDGLIRWEQYRDKQALTNSFAYKRDKYGWTYEQWVEYNKSRGRTGASNPNYATSYYQRWLDKYGKSTADAMNNAASARKSQHAAKNATDVTKQKLRIAAIERMRRAGQNAPNYNSEACRYFDRLMKETGVHIQHAENGGEFFVAELGYWVDGYDAENNVVYEFDEPHHYRNGELRERDARRQAEIEQHLNCQFIRIIHENKKD